MGIKDLLRFMKPYIEPIHIKKYAGKRVGIDAYSWLHKGAYSCSMELCLNLDSEKKSRYLEYFMHRINLLRYYKITPVVVFDGGNLPCKAATEEERHRKRSVNRELAMVKFKEGNVRVASELFQRAVSITPSMAHKLIQILRSENIEFVVAPYEADAQLAYLSSLEAEKGGITAVITEDSDLMAYGCPAIIFKMDRDGNGEAIELAEGMCVFAGCDFLPSVPGIGIARAHAMVSKYRNLDRALSVLKFEKGNQMPEDYCRSFKEAVAVFQHARIYDANAKEIKHMKPISENLLQSLEGELDFLGPEIPPAIVTAIAEGNLNPITMEAFDNFPVRSLLNSGPIVLQTSGGLQKIEAPAVVTGDSCFMVFSHDTSEDKHRKNLISKKEKYSSDALALEKLIMPLGSCGRVEKTSSPDETPLKVPDNNPFQIRKTRIALARSQSTSEQVALAGDSENQKVLCLSPDIIELKVSESPSSKRILQKICSDQMESITQQVSVVTEVDNLDILCTNKESLRKYKFKAKEACCFKRES
ncbi:Exonuclease 1 [Quillaja saponaria]|uniref:Exonuclease 1 n=1 Tax=Quillaja saponaria TaxID=32244 RepID=A0AAD7Q5J0_QUISA|nr:Exonuclease 1 [Quillaja saponaria]